VGGHNQQYVVKYSDYCGYCNVCRPRYLEQTDDDPLLDIDGVRLTDSALADGDIIVIMSRDTLAGGDVALLDAIMALNESCFCS